MTVSPRSRRRFEDLCAGYVTVARIERVFRDGGIEPQDDPDDATVRERRRAVRRYERGLDRLGDGSDEQRLDIYLDLLAEMDPADDGWRKAGDAVIESLIGDGLPVTRSGRKAATPLAGLSDLLEERGLLSPAVLGDHIQRINRSIEADPPAAIGACKDLLEAQMRLILTAFDETPGRGEDLPGLYKRVSRLLSINRESVDKSAPAGSAADAALRSMSGAVQALAQMRNELGVGHGRTHRSQALARHARLAAALAAGVAVFLLDTSDERGLAGRQRPSAP